MNQKKSESIAWAATRAPSPELSFVCLLSAGWVGKGAKRFQWSATMENSDFALLRGWIQLETARHPSQMQAKYGFGGGRPPAELEPRESNLVLTLSLARPMRAAPPPCPFHRLKPTENLAQPANFSREMLSTIASVETDRDPVSQRDKFKSRESQNDTANSIWIFQAIEPSNKN